MYTLYLRKLATVQKKLTSINFLVGKFSKIFIALEIKGWISENENWQHRTEGFLLIYQIQIKIIR